MNSNETYCLVNKGFWATIVLLVAVFLAAILFSVEVPEKKNSELSREEIAVELDQQWEQDYSLKNDIVKNCYRGDIQYLPDRCGWTHWSNFKLCSDGKYHLDETIFISHLIYCADKEKLDEVIS